MKLVIELKAKSQYCEECIFCDKVKQKCWLYEDLLVGLNAGIKRCASCLKAEEETARLKSQAPVCLAEQNRLAIRVVIEVDVVGSRCGSCSFGKIDMPHCRLFRAIRTSHHRRFNRCNECRQAERLFRRIEPGAGVYLDDSD